MAAIGKKLLSRFGAKKEPASAQPPRPQGRAPSVDWAAIVDMYLYQVRNSAAENERRQGTFHPSEGLLPSLEGCVRRTVLDLICAPKSDQNVDAGLRRIWDHGHCVQAKVDGWFTDMAKRGFMGITSYRHHIKLEHPGLPIDGEADSIVGTESGHEYLTDTKTINTKDFKTLLGPSDKYRAQLNLYMGMAGVKTGYIWYEDKNNQRWTRPMDPFRVDFDEAMFREQESYCMGILREYVHKAQLPEYNPKVCDENGCSYVKACVAHREGEKDFVDLDLRTPEQRRKQLRMKRLQVLP